MIKFKIVVWFFVIILMALSFPLQVKFGSPIPAIFPYIGIILIFVLTFFSRPPKIGNFNLWIKSKSIVLMVKIFIILVLFQSGWQVLLGVISIENFISIAAIYILPITFFYYFKTYANDLELKAVILAVAIVGFFIGVYFVYDSYSILRLGKINAYAVQAFEYSQSRTDLSVNDMNTGRLTITSRSQGLLEKHSVSAAWVSFSCFALLSFIKKKATIKRAFIITFYSMILLIGLNFTGIIGFFLVIFLIEFNGVSLFCGRISKQGIKVFAIIILAFFCVGYLFILYIGEEMLGIVEKDLSFQLSLAKGESLIDNNETSYFMGFANSILSYPKNMLNYPLGLLIGDGFSSSFGIPKGGDFGFSETLHRFGLPFFVILIAGLFSLIKRATQKLNYSYHEFILEMSQLRFAVCVIIYLLVTEIHYSVWNSKSIFPIFFIAIVIFMRSLDPKLITSIKSNS